MQITDTIKTVVVGGGALAASKAASTLTPDHMDTLNQLAPLVVQLFIGFVTSVKLFKDLFQKKKAADN